MKTAIFLFAATMVLAVSCDSPTSPSEQLYGVTWELEYMSGPRIAFEGLFPDKKPQLTFDKNENRVVGTDSCNGYSAAYTLEGNALSFGEPGPSTMMFCGGSERLFRQLIEKIDGFAFEEGKLNLLIGDIPMMRFKKVAP